MEKGKAVYSYDFGCGVLGLCYVKNSIGKQRQIRPPWPSSSPFTKYFCHASNQQTHIFEI
jgi:hypothetical protein